VTGLASRLYAEALSSRDASAAELLERCKRIIDRKAPASWESAANAESALAAGDALAPMESASSQAAARPSDTSISAEQASPPAAPAQSLAEPTMPRLSSSAAEQNSSPQPVRVQLTGAPSRQATLVDREAPIRLSDIGDRALELAEADSGETLDRKLRAAQPFDASGDNPPASPGGHAADDRSYAAENEESRAEEALAGIDSLTIDQLVRLLASVQPRVAQAAALSLRRKGMSDDKLDLAMQLAGGSAPERKSILQSLGQRSDLDPRPWLLWMAADGDEAVREQAVGMLAPLLDQEVRRQLRLLLNKERDERVAQTIRRVLMQ
jgi:hypothetical protein